MSFKVPLKKTDKKLEVKVCVFGDPGCGKTSLIECFQQSNKINNSQNINFQDQNINHLNSSIEESLLNPSIKCVQVHHFNSIFYINECSTFQDLESLHKEDCVIIILVSDLSRMLIDKVKEIESVQNKLQFIQKLSAGTILVGSKFDLLAQLMQNSIQDVDNSQKQLNQQRRKNNQTPSDILKKLASQNGCACYIQTSAKENQNVSIVFELASGEFQTQKLLTDIKGQSQNKGGSKIESKQNIKLKNINFSPQMDEDNQIYYSSCF